MKKREQRNLINKKFGRLLVIGSCGQKNGKGHFYSKVRCECGKEYLVTDTELIHGRRTACQKCINKTHGITNTRLFHIWQSMKDRCCNPNKKEYQYYGRRGIEVCKEWQKDFLSFYRWSINNGYAENLTIDRIDTNGNYEPSNCRWVGYETQANNKRNNHLILFNNETKTLHQWSTIYGVPASTILYRLKHGWATKQALTIKPKIGRNQYEEKKYID